MIHLATGLTPNFMPRGQRFYSDLRKNCNVPVTFFAVNFDSGCPAEISWANIVPVNSATNQIEMPKWMLQHGGFTQYAPRSWMSNDVVIFTDGDAKFQRPFTELELNYLNGVEDRELLIGPNFPFVQFLENEATRIFPSKEPAYIAERFPGYEKMVCRNCGFIVARMSTWRNLFQATCAITPDALDCFDNPAVVQFIIMYAIQADPWFKLGCLPVIIHSHGHVGVFPGVNFNHTNQCWEFQGQVIAFAHAL